MGIVRNALITTSLACLLGACGGGELYDPPGDWRVPGWPADLAGDWAQVTLGDCIHYEEWWRLRPPGMMEHVLVDRNACQPGSVTHTGGAMTAGAGGQVDLSWGDERVGDFRRFGALVVERVAAHQPDLWPPDYALGPRALNTMAFSPDPGRHAFVRADWRSRIDARDGLYLDQRLSAQIVLDPPLASDGSRTTYAMRIRVSAEIDRGTDAPPATGTFETSFEAHMATDPGAGWVRLVPEGFDGQTPRMRWASYVRSHPAAAELPGQVVDLVAWWFVPVLVLDPAGSGRLFNDLPEAWYQELRSPPPERVE